MSEHVRTMPPAAANGTVSALAAWRDRHRGADFVVCGCGVSLQDLACPREVVTIGVNDVGRLFDPTYLVVVNPRSQFQNERFRHVEQSNARALFTQLDLGPVHPPVVRFRLGRFGGTDIGTEDVLHYAQNSPYVAACLAAYMGARRIGLIGVDLTDHHFFARTGRHALAGRLREIDAQYGSLRAALEARGVELVNLSRSSRLASLPRAGIDPDGTWSGTTRSTDKEPTMKVLEAPPAKGLVAQLMETLSGTVRSLGYRVARDPSHFTRDARAIAIEWNGRFSQHRGPTLYCEHGWLPRSDYQISPRGINAASHIAPFEWDGTPLPADEESALAAHLAAIKAASYTGHYRYMQPGLEAAAGLPPGFLLVPLQMEYDTNLVRHAPAHLRAMQALVDHVSGANPPWPVIFKQHPMDAQRGNRHLQLRVRRAQDALWAHARGNIHQMLKSGACRGIVTINSNAAHDGLLWDVPAVVLGRNVWPVRGAVTPFLTAIPRDWSLLEASVTAPEAVACRRAYAGFLMRNQWTLADARDPARVGRLVESALGAARSAAPTVRRAAVVAARSTNPLVNVVAANRGWLFETWKRLYASTAHPGTEVVASDTPVLHADAWIFVRAREAATSPAPARTVVQLHDLLDAGRYRTGGERAVVRECGAVSLTHRRQAEILAASGVDLSSRRHVVQPVGWLEAPDPPAVRAAVPTVAWIGRPAVHDGVDVARLALFIDAMRGVRMRVRVALVGEHLETAAAALSRAGIECILHGLAHFPIDRAAAWMRSFDCVAITGGADAGPWPLFDALRAGVPVISVPVGWAADVLADGACGSLAETPEAMRGAIEGILTARDEWQQRNAGLRARVEAWNAAAWVRANLDAARLLAESGARREAA